VHQDVARILFSEAQITAGIDRLAGDVTRAYADRPFTVVAVLKGSCVFVADLIRRIPVPLQLAFVGASSYRERDRPGALELGFFPLERELRGQHLLLVDDILDTGRTLSRLKAELEQRGAASVASCVFLDKPSRRSIPFEPDFRCFEVEDVFVVGYGLDYAGHYRNLPYVGALAERVWARPEVLSKRD
jgi:hypoxanthine phosphoribosyltransferase